MKGRDRVTVAALRSALAAIENAEAIEVAAPARQHAGSEHVAGGVVGLGASEAQRRAVTDAEVVALVQGQVDERAHAARDYDRVGRPADAERLRAEADVLARYLRTPG